MLDGIIRFSLHNRAIVAIASLLAMIVGISLMRTMPVDVFPDLNRPTVTIMTEAPGLAPEEVEVLVTRQIELLLNGATGVKRVRSSSAIGLSIIWVEFDWGTDIFIDRQIVNEKLQLAQSKLPPNTNPTLAPISSIMGEIMLLALRSDSPAKSPAEADAKAMELRTLGEFTVRNRLLAVEGVSQVSVMGGILRQYQVLTSPSRLAARNVTLAQLTEATTKANVLAGGGVMNRGDKESLLRIQGQSLTLEEIAATPIIWREQIPIRVGDVADVVFGGPIKRGDASAVIKIDADTHFAVAYSKEYEQSKATEKPTEQSIPESNRATPRAYRELRGGTAVMLTVQKQPDADTIALDKRIDLVLESLRQELPADVKIETEIFRQSDFIEAAVTNVSEAVRDGAIWVVVILFLLMGNFRTSISSLTSMPLSILLTIIIFYIFGITINTMTLGGIAVAIGDLVDDSIVDIENIYRRLRENKQLPIVEQKAPIDVIFSASSEIRNSIVYATLIVVLVVVPLFMMSGLEGRLFAPLGIAYIVALLCSLAVSLTFTPVLASVLLPNAPFLADKREPLFMRWLKSVDERMLRWTLNRPRLVLGGVSMLVLLSCLTLPWMGGEFLPPFNEGTATINLRLEPGTSLAESQRLAGRVESIIVEVPEVLSVARRTGRAELDEHAEGVNNTEFEVRFAEYKTDKPGWYYTILRAIPIAHLWSFDYRGRPQEEVFADLRDRISSIPGAAVNIGQPISHRLDHMMSGIRAQIAIKVFGPDLRELRTAAYDIQARMQAIDGIVDLQIEPQIEISQVQMRVKREQAARYGLAPGDVAELLETAFKGRVVSQVIEEDKYFSMVVWYDEDSRRDPKVIEETIIETPSGTKVALSQVAEVLDTTGPNVLNRENVQRRVAVFCNVQGRDLSSVVADIKTALTPVEETLRDLPGEYYLDYSGQFEAQQEATLRLWGLAVLSMVGVYLLLMKALGSQRAALQVIANVPLAAFGAIVALLVVNRPELAELSKHAWYTWPLVWIQSTHLSLAHWVGFITLIGIVSRNGIMMISHYQHLMDAEDMPFGKEMIIRGSLERLAPVMMTAMTSFIGLVPLLFGYGEPGKEILYPLSVVLFGGMLASTILDQLVTPALFYLFGSSEPPIAARNPVND
ncbi:MAG: efflux RND transporter permease subunit [Planctomycetota bacterium]